MKFKKNKTTSHLHRRKFLSMASLAAATGFTAGPLWVSAIPLVKINNRVQDMDQYKVPENQAGEIFETKVICRQPGKYLGSGTVYDVGVSSQPTIGKRVIESDRYMGWPTIAKTQVGELIVAFSGDRDAHVCPWGKSQIIRSHDQGKTWSDAETITNTPLDDRDTGLIQSNKGTLIISWFTSVAFTLPIYRTAYDRYARIAEKLTPEVRKQWLGNWVRRSEDSGKTWLPPVRTIASGPHGPIQLKDGRLLYIGNGEHNGKSTIVIEESPDDGRTWHVLTTIDRPADMPAGTGLNEPHMTELKNGKLIAMIRHEPKDRQCFLLQSESIDGGKTWSPLHNTGIWGYPPHVLQLRNGWVLVSYGYRRQPFGQRACISRDEGKTWDVENQVILTGALGADMGYPSSVQLDDDSILTVYYQAEKVDGPTVLQSTHWRIT